MGQEVFQNIGKWKPTKLCFSFLIAVSNSLLAMLTILSIVFMYNSRTLQGRLDNCGKHLVLYLLQK